MANQLTFKEVVEGKVNEVDCRKGSTSRKKETEDVGNAKVSVSVSEALSEALSEAKSEEISRKKEVLSGSGEEDEEEREGGEGKKGTKKCRRRRKNKDKEKEKKTKQEESFMVTEPSAAPGEWARTKNK
jgi:hypothetical protein